MAGNPNTMRKMRDGVYHRDFFKDERRSLTDGLIPDGSNGPKEEKSKLTFSLAEAFDKVQVVPAPAYSKLAKNETPRKS
jgi:hypothetical protein